MQSQAAFGCLRSLRVNHRVNHIDGHFECPLWVISGHQLAVRGCPLLSQKRTWAGKYAARWSQSVKIPINHIGFMAGDSELPRICGFLAAHTAKPGDRAPRRRWWLRRRQPIFMAGKHFKSSQYGCVVREAGGAASVTQRSGLQIFRAPSQWHLADIDSDTDHVDCWG